MKTRIRIPRQLVVLFGAVTVSAAVLAAAYWWLWWARPVGQGPAGPAVERTRFDQPWTQRKVVLLGLGDSITAGFGAATPDRAFFRRLATGADDEWPDVAGCNLARVLPALEVRNLAISGSTSLQHARIFPNKLPTFGPDVFGLVLLTTGGNDLVHFYGRAPPVEGAMFGATLAQAEPWIAAFRVRLDAMLDLIQGRFPGGCEIFLADIYDPTDGTGDTKSLLLPAWPDGLAILERYNQVIHDCARSRPGVHLVPIHQRFLGHGSKCRQFWRPTYSRRDPTCWYFVNVEDPNDRGHDALRRIFLNTILEHSQLSARPPASSAAQPLLDRGNSFAAFARGAPSRPARYQRPAAR